MPARWIDVFECHAIEGTSGAVAETLQRLIGVLPFVMQVIRRTFGWFLPSRSRHSNSRRDTVCAVLDRLKTAGKSLPCDHLEQEQQGIIKAVEPNNRLPAVAVSVPRHRWSKDQVSLLHRDLFSFNDRVGSAALEYEPERREIVPVILGHFPRLQKLHGHEHRMRGRPLSSVLLSLIRRIDESQNPPFRLAVEAVHVAHGLDRTVQVLPLP